MERLVYKEKSKRPSYVTIVMSYGDIATVGMNHDATTIAQ